MTEYKRSYVLTLSCPDTIPLSPTAEEQEKRLLALFSDLQADLIVLARYMQILTDTACQQLAGRAINIHHSFIPGLKSARSYHQACARCAFIRFRWG
jgi:formyltetrahydrofolate deformylase